MKKLVFLTMMFGFMVVFSGSASAQLKAVVVNVNGSGGLKPKVGERVVAASHDPQSDAPEIGVKKGQRVCMVGIFNGGQQASVLFNLDCSKAGKWRDDFKIAKVENPKNLDIIKGDKVNIDGNKFTLTFMRGNTQTIKITYK